MNSLEYAIEMEHSGEAYYRKQAVLNEGNSLYWVCMHLAEDEKHHAHILEERLAHPNIPLKEVDIEARSRNVFQGLKDLQEGEETLEQLDFYRQVLMMEQKSIDLYQQMLDEAKELEDRKLFSYLIGQEEMHYQVMNQLIVLLGHGEDWVENAEFGLREDY